MTQDHLFPERGARVRFPPPLVFAFAIAAGVGCRYIVAAAPVPVDRAVSVIGGIVMLALGVALVASARILFLRTGQCPTPWSPSPELIARGPYRFTRNPMYVGVTLIVLGLGVAFDNLWISSFAPLALLTVHFIAVLPEERYLREKFGRTYETYLTRVRRYV